MPGCRFGHAHQNVELGYLVEIIDSADILRNITNSLLYNMLNVEVLPLNISRRQCIWSFLRKKFSGFAKTAVSRVENGDMSPAVEKHNDIAEDTETEGAILIMETGQ